MERHASLFPQKRGTKRKTRNQPQGQGGFLERSNPVTYLLFIDQVGRQVYYHPLALWHRTFIIGNHINNIYNIILLMIDYISHHRLNHIHCSICPPQEGKVWMRKGSWEKGLVWMRDICTSTGDCWQTAGCMWCSSMWWWIDLFFPVYQSINLVVGYISILTYLSCIDLYHIYKNQNQLYCILYLVRSNKLSTGWTGKWTKWGGRRGSHLSSFSPVYYRSLYSDMPSPSYLIPISY